MSMPLAVRDSVFQYLWKEADRIGWNQLTITEKTLQYNNWAQSEKVGGVLSRYMSVERIHPYIKDSIMKVYAKNNKMPLNTVLSLAGYRHDEKVLKEFIKPFGVLLETNEVIVWGRAVDWKIILLSIFERTYNNSAQPACVILNSTVGKFSNSEFQDLVLSGAKRLGVKSVIFD